MKKLVLMLLMIGAVVAGQCADNNKGIKFEKGTLKTILEKATKENKFVFIDVYATWCGPCKRMAADIFPQEKVGNYFNKTFVNAKFDAEAGEGIDIARKYGVRSYPTFLMLNGNGEEVGRMVGGSSADDFIKQIEALRQKALKK